MGLKTDINIICWVLVGIINILRCIIGEPCYWITYWLCYIMLMITLISKEN